MFRLEFGYFVIWVGFYCEIIENLMDLLFIQCGGLTGFGFDDDLFDEGFGLFLGFEFVKLEGFVGTDMFADCLFGLVECGGKFLL